MRALLAAAAAMEAAKLELIASYLWLVFGRSAPALPLASALIISFIIGRVLRRRGGARGLRRWVPLLVHAACFALLSAAALPREADSLGKALLLSALAASWLRGAWLESRISAGQSREFLCIRFDEGMLVFLLALIFAAILGADNPSARPLGSAFLAFSILALGLSRRGARAAAETAPKTRGFASQTRRTSLLGAAAGFGLAALGLFRLMPLLQAPAVRTAQALGRAGRGFLGLIERILLWLFKPGKAKIARNLTESGSFQAQDPIAAEQTQSPFAAIAMYILLGAAALAILTLLGYLIFLLVRYLSGRTAPSPEAADGTPSLFARLAAFLRRLIHAIKSIFGRLSGAASARRRLKSPARLAFSRLLACGKAAGRPRKAAETPREYGARLAAFFPAKASSIAVVRSALEDEAYAGRDAQPRGIEAERYGRELAKASASLVPALFFLGAILGMAKRKEAGE